MLGHSIDDTRSRLCCNLQTVCAEQCKKLTCLTLITYTISEYRCEVWRLISRWPEHLDEFSAGKLQKSKFEAFNLSI